MYQLLWVGLGGFIGSCLRYIVSAGSLRLFGSQMPYGTLIVNVAGGVIIGIIMELSLNTTLVSENLRLFLATGILGGFTTFSTFSYETIALLNEGRVAAGMLNVGLNLCLSLLGVVAGKAISKIVL